MGLLNFFRKSDSGHGVDELARRLGVTEAELAAITPRYRTFSIPKRTNGQRTINSPEPHLKAMQRRILRRVLGLLLSHPAVKGFERGQSIVTNAQPHVSKAVIVRIDLRDFFPSTGHKRVRKFFGKIGWNNEASKRLTELCCHDGGLPQGAPTSPRLSNLVNVMLDKRLEGAAKKFGAQYTRYADDLTFSFERDDRTNVQQLIGLAMLIVRDEGYEPHMKKKLRIRRRHQRQCVTGLVVNQRPNLPRDTRRRLRAIEHHLRTGKPATLTPPQLEGWRSLQSMIETQRETTS